MWSQVWWTFLNKGCYTSTEGLHVMNQEISVLGSGSSLAPPFIWVHIVNALHFLSKTALIFTFMGNSNCPEV